MTSTCVCRGDIRRWIDGGHDRSGRGELDANGADGSVASLRIQVLGGEVLVLDA